MKIVFISDHMKFSGGRMLMFLYADYLRRKGHDSRIIVEKEIGGLAGQFQVETVPSLSREHIPDCDLLVATSPKEVRQAWDSGRGRVVHFCQGFELTDLQQRLAGRVLPPRYQGKGFIHAMRILKKKFTWARKLREFDSVYKLPTHLITVSSHLKKELEQLYGRPAHLCRNGVRLDLFTPRKDWKFEPFSEKRPMRVINIGPYDVTYKGVQTTLEAVGMARARGVPVEFTRITPIPSNKELGAGRDYKTHTKLPQDEFCEILRGHDVYVSNSTEREGFGLPAMEAMASGNICVLSSILCYRSFAESRDDHCLFVPEGDAKATADALERIHKMREEEYGRIRQNALAVAADFSHDKACGVFEDILKRISAGKNALACLPLLCDEALENLLCFCLA